MPEKPTLRPRADPGNAAKVEVDTARHAGLAADLARCGWLIQRRAWRHIKTEFAGHRFVQLAALSGAIADASLMVPADLLRPALIVFGAGLDRGEMVADMLIVFGPNDG